MKKTHEKNINHLQGQTSIGELVEAIYDAALEEYMDEALARRIAMQALLRKLREHDRLIQKRLKEKING